MQDLGTTLRLAAACDAEALADLAARTFALACPPHTSRADIDRHIAASLSTTAFCQDLADPAVTMLIADRCVGPCTCAGSHTPVGYVMVVADSPPPDGPRGLRPLELRRIYVASDHHGTDVAPRLIAAVLNLARERGHDVVWLGTNKLNERAIRFYRKSGFDITGHKTFQVGFAVEDDYVMLRRIAPTASEAAPADPASAEPSPAAPADRAQARDSNSPSAAAKPSTERGS